MKDLALAETQTEAVAILSIISRAATDPSVDIDKMERLMQMQERAVERQAEQSFNTALNHAQSQMGRVSTDALNPQTKSRYASYAALDKSLRPIYTNNGFSLSFDTGPGAEEGCIRVLCHVSHAAGHSRRYQVDMPADGKGAKGGDVMTKTHAAGAAMSYGMRYLLKMIFNVAVGEDDDDGNGAGNSVVSFEEAAKIREWIEAAGLTEARFCRSYDIESVEDLSAKKYNEAIKALKDKKALNDKKVPA